MNSNAVGNNTAVEDADNLAPPGMSLLSLSTLNLVYRVGRSTTRSAAEKITSAATNSLEPTRARRRTVPPR
jgi:hypothetical protein